MAKRLEISDEFSPVFNRILETCKERNTTVSALLDLFAGSRSAVGAWKKGNINAGRLAEIAEYLDVTTEYLLTGKNAGSLSGTEKKLIADFRNLSPEGQAYLQQQMEIAGKIYRK